MLKIIVKAIHNSTFARHSIPQLIHNSTNSHPRPLQVYPHFHSPQAGISFLSSKSGENLSRNKQFFSRYLARNAARPKQPPDPRRGRLAVAVVSISLRQDIGPGYRIAKAIILYKARFVQGASVE